MTDITAKPERTPIGPMEERLLNLLIFLLHRTGGEASTETIGNKVFGYEKPTSADARERLSSMLSEDVSRLQVTGVPITRIDTGGVRLDTDVYGLPEIDFTPDEAAVITLAGSLSDGSQLGSFARSGWRKLKVDGRIDADRPVSEPVKFLDDNLSMDDSVITTLLAATDENMVCSFGYRAFDKAVAEKRKLEPWGLVNHEGKMYLVGWDPEKKDTRCFRVSKLTDVRKTGDEATVDKPAPADIRALVEKTLDSLAPRVDAVVTVSPTAPPPVVRFVTGGVALQPGRYRLLHVVRPELVSTALKFGPDLVVESPADVVDDIVAGLDALIEQHSN
ncbi:helix-turn-helix transcriptional regulator [Corynebacterium mendelii]|uniref:WYL domain-containing protein n=1 Tax=Corynebacterium mendelii TaxID=2765362 RepID=A0A939DYD8_9CORY|nr:WYL domain-containing protein [Corynebacterium mendelii]MBN9643510.1 WYL domain-containing protein [Corynebacterium mendelii]